MLTHTDAVISPLGQLVAAHRALVLVFLPSTNELQRFVLSGAFDDLAKTYRVHFIVRSKDVEKMRAAAPTMLREDNTQVFDIPDERYREWVRVFELSCHVYAERSRSFALRVASPESLKNAGSDSIAVTDFDIVLLGTAWRVALRLRPILRRIPWLTRRWGEPSFKRMKRINKLMQSNASVAQFVGDETLKVRRATLKVKRASLKAKLRGVVPYQPLIALLDRLDPLFCVIPTSLLDTYCNDLLLASWTMRHTVLALQSGWDNLSSKGIIHHAPTCFGVWGQQSKVHAGQIQRVDATEVLGAPHYEFLIPASPEERERFRRQLGIGPDQRLVLFGGSFRQFDETSVLQRLDDAIDDGRLGSAPVKVLYRPHPWRADRLKEDNFFEQIWRHVVFDPDMHCRYMRSKTERGFLKTAPMYDMSYLALLLSAVDAVISPMSTLLLESLIIDRPTMAVAFGDDVHAYNPALSAQMTHFNEIRPTKVIEWCDDEKKFERSCRALLSRCGRPNDPVLRKATLDQIVMMSNTTYSKRLNDLARTKLEPIARSRRTKRVERLRSSHSHSYHAHLILKDYCNLPEVKSVPGYWMHGWIPAHHNLHIALVATHKRPGVGVEHDYVSQIETEKETMPQWVARTDQELYLRSQGYNRVRAIGVPFAYLPQINCERVLGSLLVMPPHSHDGHGPGDPLAEAYAAAIAEKRNEFSEIWVCLNAYDYDRSEWVEAFRKHDIPVFVGAEQGDPKTLYRLKYLLSSFEYVTTNGFGSHIAYAAAAGAKVSIFGPFADHPREAMTTAWAAKVDLGLVDVLCDLHSEAVVRRTLPFLLTEPEKAIAHQEWGFREIGADMRLAPDALTDLFGWRTDTQRPASEQLAIASPA